MAGRDGSAPFELAEVVERYESWYATPYGRIADELERGMLRELLAPLAPGATILEVGCGTGHFAAAFAGAGYRVAGVDPSPSMLAVARGRVPVVQADGLRLPFRDGAFDGAFAISVLEFVADPAGLLAEARRVARRRVVIVAIDARSYLGLRRRAAGWLGHPIFSRARLRSRGELLDAARAAGAVVEDTRSALLLPPALAGRFPALERSLSRRSPVPGGVFAMALSGGAP